MKREEASFRDPDGFIFRKDGEILRQVNESYREDYEKLMESGLYEELVEKGLLVEHEERESEKAYKVLKPEEIEFISYPYEWSFSQLKDAALLTLEIQKIANEYGMTLKDASAYNVQFKNGKPVFIDTLSFEKKEDGLWNGYRQFCKHFIGPLALMSYTDERLFSMMQTDVNGIPVDLASKLLPKRTKLRLGLLIHIHLHARFQDRHADSEGSDKELSDLMSKSLLSNLETTIKKLKWSPEGTEWHDYYEKTHNYTEEGLEHKEKLVGEFTEKADPENIWDFGGNNGHFSRIAADTAEAYTVSFDIDPAAVEQNYRKLKEEGRENILPLVQDLTNPSPGIGWKNTERKKITERGTPDLGIALALIHHLAISNNLPLSEIASFFSERTDNLIIEFVPKSDSNAQRLLSSREDIFGEYEEENFEQEFKEHYKIVEKEKIKDSGRTLYLMEK
ncbi:MAG: class I SAM-dependent methyltransferase [Candidatus Nanohaloarchaea archaeon]